MPQTVQDMIKQVEQENLANVAARSVANPNQLIVGGQVGSTAANGIPQTAVINQAFTRTGAPYTAPLPEPTPTPVRYDASGAVMGTGAKVATDAQGNKIATNVNYGTDAQGNSLAPANVQAAGYGSQPLTEDQIREQVRKQQQGQIDAINAAYNAMIGQQDITNTSNMGSTRAINARNGLLESDFGNTNMRDQQAAGDRAVAAINAERGAKINTVLSAVNQMAEQKIAAQKAEAMGQANALKDTLAKQQTQAAGYIKSLGANGTTLDDLKTNSPDQLKALLKSSGMSEAELALAMNAARPAKQKIDWKTDIQGNTAIVYGVDPITGEMQYHTQTLPSDLPQGNKVQVVNNQLWSISPNGKSASVIGGEAKQDIPASAQEYEYAKTQGFKGTFEDYQNEDANRKIKVAAITAGGLNSVQQSVAFKLSDDYEKASGTLGATIQNYNKVSEVAKNATPAGDISLIFAYMKMLDPTSVVREGEFATAQNAAGVPTKIQNMWNKSLEGTRLSETQRKDFTDQAKKLYDAAMKQQEQIDKTFTGRAMKYEVPPDLVIRTQASYQPTNSPEIDTQVQEMKDAGYSQEQIDQALGKINDLSRSEKGSYSLVVSNPNPTKVIASATGTYDFSNYATDPNWGNAVKSHLSKMPSFENAEDITSFIKNQAPDSPITGQMVVASAQKFGVDPKIILAIAKQEANFGTLGRAARTFNPGNVGNIDSGSNVNWGSWQSGLDALARNISKRQLA